jgi:hypothetical protein
MPAGPQDLLAMVLNAEETSHNVDRARCLSNAGDTWYGDNVDFFGDLIPLKGANTLRIGFQNIGGFSFKKDRLKDDKIRMGISQ